MTAAAPGPKKSGSGLRVAMVMDRFPHEPFLARQVAALMKRSVDVHVLCQIHDRTSDVWSVLDGVDMTGRIHPWPQRGRPLALAVAAARVGTRAVIANRAELLAAIRAERHMPLNDRLAGRVLFDARVLAVDPDVVHFQFGDLARRRVHLAGAVATAFSSSFRGYDLAYAGLDQPHFYDSLWPVLDGAHTLGQDLLRRAGDRGCPADFHWTIIAPAVDLDWFAAPDRRATARRPGEPTRIVTVGRLHWKKGLVDGLASVAATVEAGRAVRYRIVGSGPAEEQVRWTIDDLGLTEIVELIGPCDAAGVRDHLAWADILLHPSLTEGFGNAVLEAQAMALPVVCSDAEGLGENVADGETGLMVPRRRPDLLAEALANLVDDRDLGLTMGERGRQRVAARFCQEAQTDAFVEFFETVARRSSGGRE